MQAGIYSTDKQVLDTFKFMKSGQSLAEVQHRSLELKISDSECVGYLTPVGEFFENDTTLISKLMNWREVNLEAYPTRFTVTEFGTSKWLSESIIENNNRLMFIISNKFGKQISYISLKIQNKICEIENVTKVDDENLNLLNVTQAQIERFIYDELGIENVQIRVLKSNLNSSDFYIANGYGIDREIPLAKIGEGIEYELRASSENICDYFLVMTKSLVDSLSAADQILTAGPSISSREVAYVADATKNGWNNHHSDYLNKFQNEFAEYVGAKFALATSSCTGALHLSLLALGIGPGDEVLVPEVTWVATASAVRYTGATPIFVDIDPATWCIDINEIEKKITSKTKAVMPVHLYGFGAEMSEILKLAKAHGISVVEDAAPAIGTLIDGKPAGSFGEFGAYSFQGAKMLVTGEGGMLVTSDPELFERARKIQDHGRKPGTFWIEELGYKYKMNNITAALGLAQLERSERQIEQKQRIASWYKELLGSNNKLTMQVENPNTRSIHWMNSITLDESLTITRDEVMEKLKTDGIDTRPVFPAISQYPFWDKKQSAGPIATKIGAQSINLPSGVKLSKKSVSKVCDAINSLIG